MMTLHLPVGGSIPAPELRRQIVWAVLSATTGRVAIQDGDLEGVFAFPGGRLETGPNVEITGLNHDRPEVATRVVDDVYYTFEPREASSGRPWKTVNLNGTDPSEVHLRDIGRRTVMVGLPFTMLGWLRDHDVEVVDRRDGLTTFRVLVPFQGLARAAGDISAEPMNGEDTETFWQVDDAGLVRSVRSQMWDFQYSDWGTAVPPVAPLPHETEGLTDWQIRLFDSFADGPVGEID